MRRFANLVCVLALGASCLTSKAAPAVGATTAPRRPNFLFVLIDDMGYADLSCYGQKKVRTPNFDRLAGEGVRFTQFYVNAPICSPSRVALLTGQYPARWRITSFLEGRASNANRGMAQWLDPKAPSVARTLKDAGYATGHFGKWHMGGQRDVGNAPLICEYGFDQSVTTFEGLGDRYLPLLDAFDGKPPRKYDLGSASLGRGHVTWVDRSTMTRAYVDVAVDFIHAAAKEGRPFYVNVWPDDVHSPFFPPAALRGDGTKEALYLGCVKAMDDQLAALFDAIRGDPALRDNTLIVVASDNGPEPGAGSAGPFRGHKGNLYEGGIREPFIVWGPGIMAAKSAGMVDETSVIAGMDLMPSLLSIAGVKVPDGATLDGEDRSAALLGRAPSARAKPIFWLRPPDRPGPAAENWPDLAMRDGQWKLLTNFDGSSARLYDLKDDPGESKDLAKDHPDVVSRMRAAVLEWYRSMSGGTAAK